MPLPNPSPFRRAYTDEQRRLSDRILRDLERGDADAIFGYSGRTRAIAAAKANAVAVRKCVSDLPERLSLLGVTGRWARSSLEAVCSRGGGVVLRDGPRYRHLAGDGVKSRRAVLNAFPELSLLEIYNSEVDAVYSGYNQPATVIYTYGSPGHQTAYGCVRGNYPVSGDDFYGAPIPSYQNWDLRVFPDTNVTIYQVGLFFREDFTFNGRAGTSASVTAQPAWSFGDDSLSLDAGPQYKAFYKHWWSDVLTWDDPTYGPPFGPEYNFYTTDPGAPTGKAVCAMARRLPIQSGSDTGGSVTTHNWLSQYDTTPGSDPTSSPDFVPEAYRDFIYHNAGDALARIETSIDGLCVYTGPTDDPADFGTGDGDAGGALFSGRVAGFDINIEDSWWDSGTDPVPFGLQILYTGCF